MKQLTKQVSDAIAAEIVTLFSEVYNWTAIIEDQNGNEVPNVSKEIFVQKIFNDNAKKLIKNARGLRRNKELGQILNESW